MDGQIASETAQAVEVVAPATTENNQAVNAESAPAAETQEQPKASETNTETKGAEPVEEPRVKLSELTDQRKKRQQAEQEAAYWRGRAEASQPAANTASQAQPQAEKVPVLDDYDTYEQYEDAKIAHGVRKALAEQSKEQTKATQEKTIDQRFTENLAKMENEMPDYEDVQKTLPIFSADVVAAVKDSELGPKLVYHLGKNPAEALRLAGLPPWAAIREIGKLEAKLSVATPAPKPKLTQAPEPITKTVGGQTSVDDDLSSLPTGDYMARRNKEVYGK